MTTTTGRRPAIGFHRPDLHYRWSLASRVMLLAAIAVGATVTVVAVAAYALVRQQSLHTLDDSLETRALTLAHNHPLDVMENYSMSPFVLGAANLKISLYNAADNTVYNAGGSTSDAKLPLGHAERRVALGKSSYVARTVTVGGEPYRVVTVPVTPGSSLSLGQSMDQTQRMLDRLGLVMLLLGVAGMIAAGLGGWGVARNGLRPVRRLRAAAEEIARTERLEPIPVEGNDEVARLAVAFNRMLGSLSASQVRQRQLVADAGHELRTPLTSLRTNLDLLIQAQGSQRLSETSRRELMDDVRGQIDEMTTLIGDLVELARDDQKPARPEAVNLSDVVADAVTRVRRRTSTVTVDVMTEPWWLRGDPTTLERAITNLLDNAVKWSPAGGVVGVTLRGGTLLVTDQGGGIPEQDLPHVFDRFYRSTESRGMPGSGLGLSIVRSVAERHGGSVRAGRTEAGGAAFWFTVPGSSEVPEEVLAGA